MIGFLSHNGKWHVWNATRIRGKTDGWAELKNPTDKTLQDKGKNILHRMVQKRIISV